MSVGSSIWQTLGIAPTSDPTEIRRAYAAKLKITNPEDDAEGFKVLRAAYEAALRWVRERDARVSQPVPAMSAAPQDAERESVHEAHEPAAPEAPTDPEIGELQKAFQALQAALAAPDDGSGARATSAFASVLSSPALGNVNLAREAEWRIAALLATTIPRSDSLLSSAAQRFGWLADGLRAAPAVAAILARLNDLAFLQSLEKKASPYASAFRGLRKRKVPVWSWLRAHVRSTGTVSEYQLLQMLRLQHPGLLPMLNADAVAWWDRVATAPRLSFALVFLGLMGGAMIMAAAWRNDFSLALGVWTFAGFLGLALWKLYLVDWPRHWLKAKWPDLRPAWLESGWLPLAVLCLAASVVGRDQRTLAFVVAGIALLTVQWSLIVRTAQSLSSNRGDQFVTFFVPQVVLAFWWAGSSSQFPGGALEPMIVPFFALVLASAIGAWTLRILWMREVTLAQRRGCATTLALLAVAAGSLLWWLAPDENWRPACVALVLTVVVLHRPLVFALSETQQRIRAGWVLVLAIGLTVLTVLETTAPALRARGVVLAGGGLMLLATSLFGTVLAARNDLRAVHAKD